MVVIKEEKFEYEWRRKYLKVKFCYGCRELKGKEEFYFLRSVNGSGYRTYKHSELCKNCEKKNTRIKYRIKNN